MFDAAVNGEIQVLVSQPLYLTYYLKGKGLPNELHRMEPPLYTHAYKAGVARGRQELIDLIDRRSAEIGRDERSTIAHRWTGGMGEVRPAIPLSPEELAWIEAHPVIRLGVDPAWPPVGLIDEQGSYRDIAADYVRLLERQLGVDMVSVERLSREEVIEGVATGGIELLPAVAASPQRRKYLAFTRPYLSFPLVIFTRREARLITGLEDLRGNRWWRRRAMSHGTI